MGPEMLNILMIGGMLLVMYFFFIRPQSQKIKEEKKFADALQKGEKVVTTGGIHGIIDKVEEGSLLLEIDRNVKIRIDRSGISRELTLAVSKEQKPAEK